MWKKAKYNYFQIISIEGVEVMVTGGWDEAMKWGNTNSRDRVGANTNGMVMAAYKR